MTLAELIQDIKDDWKYLAGAGLVALIPLIGLAYSNYDDFIRKNRAISVTTERTLEREQKAEQLEEQKRQEDSKKQCRDHEYQKGMQELKQIGEEIYKMEQKAKERDYIQPTTQPQNQRQAQYSNEDKLILAKMIFGEARDCDNEAKIAIAHTAINRLNDSKKRYGSTLKEVILKDKKYSCFNKDDPNRLKALQPQDHDYQKWQECLSVAEKALSSPDPIKGADHYFCFYEFKNQERRNNQMPYWTRGENPTRVIHQQGWNVNKQLMFYN